jgi:hypothetical protein
MAARYRAVKAATRLRRTTRATPFPIRTSAAKAPRARLHPLWRVVQRLVTSAWQVVPEASDETTE